MSHNSLHTDELLSTAEVAQMLGVQPRTVDNYRREGKLPYLRFSIRKVKYRKRDVEEFISACYCPARDYEL